MKVQPLELYTKNPNEHLPELGILSSDAGKLSKSSPDFIDVTVDRRYHKPKIIHIFTAGHEHDTQRPPPSIPETQTKGKQATGAPGSLALWEGEASGEGGCAGPWS